MAGRALAAGGGVLAPVVGLSADPVRAKSGQSLQEAAQNPIADLISVGAQVLLQCRHARIRA
jgi:hypothetical protein